MGLSATGVISHTCAVCPLYCAVSRCCCLLYCSAYPAAQDTQSTSSSNNLRRPTITQCTELRCPSSRGSNLQGRRLTIAATTTRQLSRPPKAVSTECHLSLQLLWLNRWCMSAAFCDAGSCCSQKACSCCFVVPLSATAAIDYEGAALMQVFHRFKTLHFLLLRVLLQLLPQLVGFPQRRWC
jgi:hypothetical protein